MGKLIKLTGTFYNKLEGERTEITFAVNLKDIKFVSLSGMKTIIYVDNPYYCGDASEPRVNKISLYEESSQFLEKFIYQEKWVRTSNVETVLKLPSGTKVRYSREDSRDRELFIDSSGYCVVTDDSGGSDLKSFMESNNGFIEYLDLV